MDGWMGIEMVLVLALALALVTRLGECIRFEVEAGHTKCIAEDIRAHSMTVGKYQVLNFNQHKMKITVRVTSALGNNYHYAENVDWGHFAFQAMDSGDYMACFYAAHPHTHPPITLDFDWKSGVAAKDWSYVAKKGSVAAMEIELKQMYDQVQSVHDEINFLREREKQMQLLNISTNSKMACLTLLSLLVCLSVAGLQLWHLKTFFQKKKLI